MVVPLTLNIWLPLQQKITRMNTLLFLGGYEWVLIIVALLLLFGGRKIPELMRGLGSGIKEFKDATKGEDSDKSIDEKK